MQLLQLFKALMKEEHKEQNTSETLRGAGLFVVRLSGVQSSETSKGTERCFTFDPVKA